MIQKTINVLLADDDSEDNFLFSKALNESAISTNLTIFDDGEQLVKYLLNPFNTLPDILFLDLSMPRKTGFECLVEIKEINRLKDIPIFILTTGFSRDVFYENDLILRLQKMGAQNLIRKPNDFDQLKNAIHQVLITIEQKHALDLEQAKNLKNPPSTTT